MVIDEEEDMLMLEWLEWSMLMSAAYVLLRNEQSDKFAGQSSYPEDRTAEVVMDFGRGSWTTTSNDMIDGNDASTTTLNYQS